MNSQTRGDAAAAERTLAGWQAKGPNQRHVHGKIFASRQLIFRAKGDVSQTEALRHSEGFALTFNDGGIGIARKFVTGFDSGVERCFDELDEFVSGPAETSCVRKIQTKLPVFPGRVPDFERAGERFVDKKIAVGLRQMGSPVLHDGEAPVIFGNDSSAFGIALIPQLRRKKGVLELGGAAEAVGVNGRGLQGKGNKEPETGWNWFRHKGACRCRIVRIS